MSKEVTEVSESFRLGRGGGGFTFEELDDEDVVPAVEDSDGSTVDGRGGGGGGGKSLRIEDARSRRCVDADEGDLRGAGGAGGKLLLTVEDVLSSAIFFSSELLLF